MGLNFNFGVAALYCANSSEALWRLPVARIKRRYYTLVFALFMSFFMSTLMSGVVTLINTGLTEGFFERWLHAGVAAWVIAFPLVSFIAPVAHWITRKLVETE